MTSHLDIEKPMEYQVESVDVVKSIPLQTDGSGDDNAEALEGQDFTTSPEEERAIIRRVDWILLPLMGIGTGLQLVDKNALGSAATLNLQRDLHLEGIQYSWAVSIYYFGLLLGTCTTEKDDQLMEDPANFLLQRYHTGRVIGVAFICWGAITLGTAGVQSFAGLAALRFLLGVFESAMAPGFTSITARFYTQAEQPLRFIFWTLANTILPILFLLVFFGLGQVSNVPLQPWRWIFILLGILTIVVGVLNWIYLPDKPSNTWWLSKHQRAVVVARVARSQTGLKNHHFKRIQALEALTDVKAWLVCLLLVFQQAGVSLQTNFLGILIKGLGFSGLKALLLQIPGWGVNLVASLIVGFAVTYVRALRTAKTLILAGVACVTLAAGVIVYSFAPVSANAPLLLTMLSIANANGIGYPLVLSLVAQNFAGSTKKQTVLAMVFICYCVSNICVPQAFAYWQAPRYQNGILTVVAFQAAYILSNIALFCLARRENSKRDSSMDSLQLEVAIEIATGLADKTDKENQLFRYAT